MRQRCRDGTSSVADVGAGCRSLPWGPGRPRRGNTRQGLQRPEDSPHNGLLSQETGRARGEILIPRAWWWYDVPRLPERMDGGGETSRANPPAFVRIGHQVLHWSGLPVLDKVSSHFAL